MSEQRLKKNIYFVGIGQAAHKLLAFLLIPFAARFLGDAGFGQFSLASAVMFVVVLLNDWGVNTYITREVAKHPEQVSKYLWNASVLKSALIFVDFVVLIVYLSLTQYPADTIKAILIFAAYGLLSSFVQLAIGVYQAFERMEFEALVLTLEKLLITALGIFVLKQGYGLLPFCVVFVVGGFASLLLSVFLLKRFFPVHRDTVKSSIMSDLFKDSLPFGLSLLFATLYNYTGIFILSILKPAEVVGWFSAGFKLINMTNMVPLILISAVYPVLSREIFANNRERVNFLYSQGFKYLFFLALPMVTGICLITDDIVLTIFGEGFYPAIPILRVLAFTAALVFFNLYFTGLLKAANRQKTMVRLQIIALFLNMGSNLILIPKYSGMGAAWSTVLTELFIFISYLIIMRHDVTPIPFQWLWLRGIAATFALAALLLLFPNLGLFPSVGIGLVLYGGLLFLTRAVTLVELLPFREGRT